MENGRRVACHVSIAEFTGGKFERGDEWNANHILIGNQAIVRANIIGVLVDMTETSITIDDGTGTLLVQSFDQQSGLVGLRLGDVVMALGRPRTFNDTLFLGAEIVRTVNREWLEVRKKEILLPIAARVPARTEQKKTPPTEKQETTPVLLKPKPSIYEFIKNNDEGQGVEITRILEENPDRDAEAIVRKMVEAGDIFEIRQGRYKILE